jgi:type VI secretion system secreted protein VgrG
MQSITLTVGGSSIKIDQMGVTIKGMMIEIDGNCMTTVKGDAMLTLKGGITMIN